MWTPAVDNFSIDFAPSSLIYMSYEYFYKGIDTIYTYSESFFLYDFNINYNLFTFNLYQDSFEYSNYAVWYNTLDISYYSLFWSVIIDNFVNSHTFNNNPINTWYKSIWAAPEYSVGLFNLPEFIILSNSFLKEYIMPVSTYIDILIGSMYEYETTLNPVLLVPHFLIFWLFAFYFLFVFFSYYTTPTREEILDDHDLLIASMTVESEEEIGCIDDILIGSAVIIFVFFWYFYSNFFFKYIDCPEYVLVAYLFPFLFYLVLFIPMSLSYDFGLYFVCYLRGVGKAPVSFVETMYDFIGFAAFYIRLYVQNVRLILMLFTFASFHELIFLNPWNKEWVLGDGTWVDDFWNAIWTPEKWAYFLIFQIPNRILYYFYEIFHLLFVITAQIIAFNAMTFWLFLFLYTMFSSTLHERFFKFQRLLKQTLIRKYKRLKKKFIKWFISI